MREPETSEKGTQRRGISQGRGVLQGRGVIAEGMRVRNGAIEEEKEVRNGYKVYESEAYACMVLGRSSRLLSFACTAHSSLAPHASLCPCAHGKVL